MTPDREKYELALERWRNAVKEWKKAIRNSHTMTYTEVSELHERWKHKLRGYRSYVTRRRNLLGI